MKQTVKRIPWEAPQAGMVSAGWKKEYALW